MIEKEYKTVDEVLNIDSSEMLDIEMKDTTEKMSIYNVARGLALIDGIRVINEKADQLKIDLEKEKSWVKPLALQKFVDEQTPSCIAQVKTLVVEDK